MAEISKRLNIKDTMKWVNERLNFLKAKFDEFINYNNPYVPDDCLTPWDSTCSTGLFTHENFTKLSYSKRPRVNEHCYNGTRLLENIIIKADNKRKKQFYYTIAQDLLQHRIILEARLKDRNNVLPILFKRKNVDALAINIFVGKWLIRMLDRLEVTKVIEVIPKEEDDIPPFLGTDIELVELLSIGIKTKKWVASNQVDLADKLARRLGKDLKGSYNQTMYKIPARGKGTLVEEYLQSLENKSKRGRKKKPVT